MGRGEFRHPGAQSFPARSVGEDAIKSRAWRVAIHLSRSTASLPTDHTVPVHTLPPFSRPPLGFGKGSLCHMKEISDIFRERATLERKRARLIRSERDEQIDRFFQRDSIKVRDSKTKKFRQASRGELALILKDCPTKDLHAVYRQCEAARSFSRSFWHSIKRKWQGTQRCQNGVKGF